MRIIFGFYVNMYKALRTVPSVVVSSPGMVSPMGAEKGVRQHRVCGLKSQVPFLVLSFKPL